MGAKSTAVTDSLYSLLLLASLLGGGIGVVAAAGVLLLRTERIRTRPVLQMLCAVGAFAAIFFGSGSALVHRRFGHGAGSAEPMEILRVLLVHRAYWVVLGCAVVSLSGWLVAQRSDRDGRAGRE
jgi:hypothetical protein